MTTINLYQNQEEQQQKNSARAANSGFFFSLGILVLTLAALFVMKFYVANLVDSNKKLAEEVKQQNENLSGVNSLQRILEMQTRLAQIKTNLDIKDSAVRKLKMTDVLDSLERDLSSGVVVTEYSFDDNKVKVAFAANNFNDAARQILNFKKSTYFTDVALGSVVRGEKNIQSEVTMSVKSKQ